MTTALEGGEGSASRPGRSFPPAKDPVPIVQEAGWAPRSVWTSAENLAPTGIRSPDRPARSQSLYRLSSQTQTAPQTYYNTVLSDYLSILVCFTYLTMIYTYVYIHNIPFVFDSP